MPTFRGKEIDEIRSWVFERGDGMYVCADVFSAFYCIAPGSESRKRVNVDREEAMHALRVLGCISGAFKTQGESNT